MVWQCVSWRLGYKTDVLGFGSYTKGLSLVVGELPAMAASAWVSRPGGDVESNMYDTKAWRARWASVWDESCAKCSSEKGELV